MIVASIKLDSRLSMSLACRMYIAKQTLKPTRQNDTLPSYISRNGVYPSLSPSEDDRRVD